MSRTVLDDLPRAFLDQVTHVGSLDPTHKGIRGDSQEGAGLSVSCHPEAWVRIAGLGDLPWWQANVSSLSLLDGHQALKRPGVLAALRAWGEAEAWITPALLFKVSWIDSETDAATHVLVATRAVAEQECSGMDEEARATIKPVKTWTPTQKLLDRMAQSNTQAGAPAPLVDQWLLTAWAQDHHWDGLWWNDALRPSHLSAPRGVVFPDRFFQLTWEQQALASASPRARRRP